MAPRDRTLPGWPAPRAFVDAAAPPGVPPTPAPVSPPPMAPVPRATLWRRTRRRVPAPRARGRPVPTMTLAPRAALAIADFRERRPAGPFDDSIGEPPPSWWAR